MEKSFSPTFPCSVASVETNCDGFISDSVFFDKCRKKKERKYKLDKQISPTRTLFCHTCTDQFIERFALCPEPHSVHPTFECYRKSVWLGKKANEQWASLEAYYVVNWMFLPRSLSFYLISLLQLHFMCISNVTYFCWVQPHFFFIWLTHLALIALWFLFLIKILCSFFLCGQIQIDLKNNK